MILLLNTEPVCYQVNEKPSATYADAAPRQQVNGRCIAPDVGKGKSALEYLSRYLYRGVISEKNIVANQDGQVTFKYVESSTGKTQTRMLKGTKFLWLVLQHVLPKGFRRVRDYGFLHGNAKKRLSLVQLVLRVIIEIATPLPGPVFTCPRCKSPMTIVAILISTLIMRHDV